MAKTVNVIQTLTTFAFPVADLLATYHAVGRDDARYYLRGVLIEPHETGPRLVATNGCVLLRSDVQGFAAAEPLIVTLDVAEKAFKARCKGAFEPWVYGDTQTGIVQVVSMPIDDTPEECLRLGVCEFDTIDATFPDYSRIVPEPKGGAQFMQFDPAHLTLMHKAGAVHDKVFTMRIEAESPDHPALIRFSRAPHMVGVIMQKRY